jgi:hypothetical protein
MQVVRAVLDRNVETTVAAVMRARAAPESLMAVPAAACSDRPAEVVFPATADRNDAALDVIFRCCDGNRQRQG